MYSSSQRTFPSRICCAIKSFTVRTFSSHDVALEDMGFDALLMRMATSSRQRHLLVRNLHEAAAPLL